MVDIVWNVFELNKTWAVGEEHRNGSANKVVEAGGALIGESKRVAFVCCNVSAPILGGFEGNTRRTHLLEGNVSHPGNAGN